ncbi:MAG: HAD family phosphatase [Lachnospiraceae bacterium]|nr:HAD family phosphatase [Lachnospiraceae bacterium]
MYKLIALDCDGTLLNSKKEITKRTILTIDKATKKGIKVVLASARPFYRLKSFITQLGLLSNDQYTIAFNGGLVVNNSGDEIVFSRGFSHIQVKELIEFGYEHQTAMFLYTKDCILSNVNDEKYKKRNPDVKFNVIDFSNIDFNDIQIYKIAYVNVPEKTKELRAKLPLDFNERYEISSSVPQFIEFVDQGITKSFALKLIGEKNKISCDEMLAFGDEDNDIPMFKLVGCGVAMGNATDEVKKLADYITGSNDDDGVAQAIEKFVL